MSEAPDGTSSLLRESARRFVQAEVLPCLEDWERAGLVPREVHVKAAQAGLLGVGFPESVGGEGGGLLERITLVDEFIRAGASSGFCAALFTRSIALPHIVDAGDAEQVERWVRPTLAGTAIGSLAVTESGGGSDVARIRTTARRDGDAFRIDGSKQYITSGVRADFITTVVRTGGPGRAGLSLIVVERDSPGLFVSPPMRKMGWWASDTAEITYRDVSVPATNLVGAEGGGFAALMRHFPDERVTLGAHAVGIAQRCLELAVEWARERHAFGEPLARKQVVRHRLAEMATRVAVARGFLYSLAVRMDQGEEAVAASAMAKNAAVSACSYVVDSAVQVFGGAGYVDGYEVERHYRDARLLGIGGGTTEIMNEIIAHSVIENDSRRS